VRRLISPELPSPSHPYRPRPSSLVLVLDCPSSFALEKTDAKIEDEDEGRNCATNIECFPSEIRDMAS